MLCGLSVIAKWPNQFELKSPRIRQQEVGRATHPRIAKKPLIRSTKIRKSCANCVGFAKRSNAGLEFFVRLLGRVNCN